MELSQNRMEFNGTSRKTVGTFASGPATLPLFTNSRPARPQLGSTVSINGRWPVIWNKTPFRLLSGSFVLLSDCHLILYSCDYFNLILILFLLLLLSLLLLLLLLLSSSALWNFSLSFSLPFCIRDIPVNRSEHRWGILPSARIRISINFKEMNRLDQKKKKKKKKKKRENFGRFLVQFWLNLSPFLVQFWSIFVPFLFHF